MARSAASTRASTVASPVASATPQAMVGSRWPTPRVLLAIRSARRRTIRSAVRMGAPAKRTANSSPPIRATRSPSRTPACKMAPTRTSASSPAAWPKPSFSALRPLASTIATDSDAPSRAASSRSSRWKKLRRFGSPVSGSVAGAVEGQEETILVAHCVADDSKEPLGEVVDVQDGADLGGEPLQDRELTAVGLSARSELLEEHARSGHVFDVLVEDPRDATELGRALRAVALDEPQEPADHSRMELSPAATQELGAGMLDRLRRLVRTPADDD